MPSVPSPLPRQCLFSERFLQIVWNEGLLVSDPVCAGRTSLRIIHPGTWNTGPGPDFRDAALLLDNRLVRGDVEIHRRSSDWLQHRHHLDPLYAGVVLHAVWEDDGGDAFLPDSGRRPIPTLVLREALLPDWQNLLTEAEEYNYSFARKIPPGACSMRWMMTDDLKITGILRQAAHSRLLRKIRRLQRNCAGQGAGQALYEAVFDALGYRQNREGFLHLARSLPLTLLLRKDLPPDAVPAVFLGSAGFLPDSSDPALPPDIVPFLRTAWDRWWETGLPRLGIDWRLGASRPYNHPLRRIAAGFTWLTRCRFRPEDWLDRLFRPDRDRRRIVREIRDSFQADGFWPGVLDFFKSVPPAALLGRSRLLDLLENVFIPFAMARADGPAAKEGLWRLYQELPPGQINHPVKEAIHRFLIPPARAKDILKKNCLQQGLLELYQNFCLAMHHDCSHCPFCHGTRPETAP